MFTDFILCVSWSDQSQNSPHSINTLSNRVATRVKIWINISICAMAQTLILIQNNQRQNSKKHLRIRVTGRSLNHVVTQANRSNLADFLSN